MTAGTIRQGDIWGAYFSTGEGREQHGFRPVLIISSSVLNESGAGMCWVIPVTRTTLGRPSHVLLDPEQTGLKQTSYAMCEQTRAVDSGRLRRRMGRVDERTRDEVLRVVGLLVSRDPYEDMPLDKDISK